jgi:hypothetical protein
MKMSELLGGNLYDLFYLTLTDQSSHQRSIYGVRFNREFGGGLPP